MWWVVLMLLFPGVAGAVDLGSPPVIQDDVALEQYLRDLRKSSRNLRVTTTSPNGNRRGLRGDTIFYNDGTDLKLCRNTSTTAGGGTSWACEAASSESQLCFEGATDDAFETCFSITDPTADRTVTIANVNSRINGITLPSGAVFYMLTGSCPAGSTDISVTYSNRFFRTNATAGTTGGSDTDSITLTATELPAHNHSTPAHSHVVKAWPSGPNAARIGVIATSSNAGPETNDATSTDGSGASGFAGSGTAFSVDTVPSFVTAILCQVD